MSTYSDTLRLELIDTGAQAGVWGDTTNNNLGDLIEAAITNKINITFANATYTLTANNGLPDEARNAVLNLIGTNSSAQNLIAPAVQKTYIIKNATGATVTIKTSAGGSTGVPIANGVTQLVWSDGTNFYSGTSGVENFTVASALTVNGASTFNTVSASGAVTASGALTTYTAASFTGSISGTTLSVTAVASGSLFVGQVISGSGITSGTYISGIISAWNGTSGSYTVSVSQTASSTTITGAAATLLTNLLVNGSANLSGTLLVAGDTTFSGTGQIKLPNGTTAQRSSSPVYGMLRYNSTTNQFEGYDGTAGETISTITHITTQATVTTATMHGLSTGTLIVVSGASPSEYNGTYSITSTGDYTFIYTMASSPATDATTVGSYTYGTWGEIGGGGTVASGAIYQNAQVITANFTVDSTKNAGSFGPITINSGVTVTVPSTSTWTIV